MIALSRAEQSAIEGREVLYQKFYLLVRMEAMVMLNMDEAASALSNLKTRVG